MQPSTWPATSSTLANRASEPRSNSKRLPWLIFIALWIALLGFGLCARFRYETTEGAAARAPALFPSGSTLPDVDARARVLMFVHPECPCTLASLREFERLLTKTTTARATLVVAETLDRPWSETDAAAIAKRIPRLAIFHDVDGVEARRFGARTSGQVVMYDAHGALRFSGGITGSRGHVGDNVGVQTLARALAEEDPRAHRAAVFGCPIEDEVP